MSEQLTPAGSPAVDPLPTDASAVPAQAAARRNLFAAAVLFLAALLICLIAYLFAAVPDGWFPSASPRAWGATELQVTRGAGEIVDGELVVKATDENGVAIVSVTTRFRSADYRAVEWIGIDFPEQADVRLLWRTDYAPQRTNLAPVEIKFGHLLPVIIHDPAWAGRITGIALAVQGPLSQPLRIRGVVVKPMGALEIVGDRAGEWLAFESWNGRSINTITGGADVQDLPLPLLLAVTVALAAACAMLLRRWRPKAFNASTAAILGAFFLLAWLVLDVRWTWNLGQQVRLTATQYAGKSWAEKHQSAEDGPLFDFVQQALHVMPGTPARVVVAADLDYFRGRAAYHLYPHSVYFEPHSTALPSASELHTGDWLLAYRQRGIQFSASTGKLRWDNGQSVAAELMLSGPGAALFIVR